MILWKQLKKWQGGESKDFIVFILQQIHKELKRSSNSQNQLGIQPFIQSKYDKKIFSIF